MDYSAAIASIDTTLAAIDLYGSKWYEDNERFTAASRTALEQADRAVQEGVSIARRIAIAAPRHVRAEHLGPRYTVLSEDRWDGARHTLTTLRAGIATELEAEAIVGPKGPSMRATSLHPWIWNAALDLWGNGHYRAAVQQAAAALEQATKAKLGVHQAGKDLFLLAFNTDDPKEGNPRLRFDIDRADKLTWTSQHEGAHRLGAGAMQFIRNDANHSTDELDQSVAFEQLAVLSLIARQVERASVERANEQ